MKKSSLVLLSLAAISLFSPQANAAAAAACTLDMTMNPSPLADIRFVANFTYTTPTAGNGAGAVEIPNSPESPGPTAFIRGIMIMVCEAARNDSNPCNSAGYPNPALSSETITVNFVSNLPGVRSSSGIRTCP